MPSVAGPLRRFSLTKRRLEQTVPGPIWTAPAEGPLLGSAAPDALSVRQSGRRRISVIFTEAREAGQTGLRHRHVAIGEDGCLHTLSR